MIEMYFINNFIQYSSQWLCYISAIFDQRAKIVFMDIRFACRRVCVMTKRLFALAEYMCH